MSNFDPRLDKWSETEFSSLGLQLKDAIFNKGKVERMRRRAAKQAQRRARWKRSLLGRFIAWIWRAIGITLGIIALSFIPLILLLMFIG